MTLLNHLQNRGLIHDVSHFDELEHLLNSRPITFYCGFDPTADSLHVGSMLPLIVMRRFQRAGHKPLLLLGSATGLIGDPSFKSDERKLLALDQVQHNLQGIRRQAERFLDPAGANAFEVVQNLDWIGKLSCIDFLREIGKHFSVNAMIAKESVRGRLEDREQGISFTEFSYMLLQAYDFYWLSRHKECLLQIGGSDQWGNITAGIDLARRKTAGQAPVQLYGLTFPLITMASGAKFGKTERGAVWLDPARTSPYRFYQYWLNIPDADVLRYLQYFTDIADDEFDALKSGLAEQPEERAPQKKLAQELTELVHGAEETRRAIAASSALFGGDLSTIDPATLEEIFSDVPSANVLRSELEHGITLVELLAECSVAQSKGAARRLVEGGGLYLNNVRVTDAGAVLSAQNLIGGSLLIIRSGKKNYYLIRAVA